MFNKNMKMDMSVYQMGADENGNRYGNSGFSENIDPSKVGLQKWKPQEGRNLIDIIPFNADKNNPLVVSGKAIEGAVLYSLDYFTHRDIGPGHSNITCLKQYGRDCPLCRENERLFNLGEAHRDEASKLRSKRRVVYVIHDLIKNTYGYWDTGWSSVEKELTKEASFCIDENTGAKINVFDWQEGMSVEFQGTKESFAGHEFIKPERFRFIKRAPLTDDVLEHSVDLSTTVKFMEPEEMERMLSNKPVSTPAAAAPVSKPVYEAPQPTMQNVSFDKLEPAASQPTASLAQEAVAEAPKPTGNVCPCGYTWGDADHHAECATCSVWDKCIS